MKQPYMSQGAHGSAGAQLTPWQEVVDFWRMAGPALWFAKDLAFDALFRERFFSRHEEAASGRLDAWASEPDGMLACLILLDQFPRNAFRGTARMYATDMLARRWTMAMAETAADRRIEPPLKLFCYLPLTHSECLADQERSVALITPLGAEPAAHAREHRDIIARFGRFPHRNGVLGRVSTAEELRFLAAGGFAG